MSRELQKVWAFMGAARAIAQLSTCKRKKVGALLLTPDFTEVLAVGYNGPPAGLPNDSCLDLDAACGCVHAEANCLVKARRHSATGLLLLVTRAPCAQCAALLVNSRAVTRVIYGEPSSAGAEGLALLHRAGILYMEAVCES